MARTGTQVRKTRGVVGDEKPVKEIKLRIGCASRRVTIRGGNNVKKGGITWPGQTKAGGLKSGGRESEGAKEKYRALRQGMEWREWGKGDGGETAKRTSGKGEKRGVRGNVRAKRGGSGGKRAIVHLDLSQKKTPRSGTKKDCERGLLKTFSEKS